MIELANVFGDFETLLSEDLYPYRFILGPLAALAALGAVLLAVRRGAHRLVLQHRALSLAVAVPVVVAGIVAGNYLLSPLWERSHLEEASPLEAVSSSSVSVPAGSNGAQKVDQMMAPADKMAATGPRVGFTGSFSGADDFHFGRGEALVIHTDDGKTVLRFEDFSVRNGPDLYVYLSREENGRRVDEALNLGRLKATDGAFNYEVPPGVDLSQVRSVVVWCRQFSTLFAVAPLTPA